VIAVAYAKVDFWTYVTFGGEFNYSDRKVNHSVKGNSIISNDARRHGIFFITIYNCCTQNNPENKIIE